MSRSQRRRRARWPRRSAVELCAIVPILMLVACGGDAGPDQASGANDADQPAENEASLWDQIIEDGQSEGQLQVGFFPREGNEAFAQHASERMRELYDIDLAFTMILPSDFVPRVLAEQNVGQHEWDAYIGSTTTILTGLHPNNLESFEEFVADLPQENRDDSVWGGGFGLYADPDDPTIFLHEMDRGSTGAYVNRDMIPRDVLDGPEDAHVLLDDEIMRQVAMEEPTAPIGSTSLLSRFLTPEMEDDYGEEFVREFLAHSELRFVGSRAQVADFVIEGRNAIGFGAESSTVESMLEAGLGGDIERLEWLGFWNGTGVSVMNEPPNPHATKLFLDWFLSHEGQDAWAELSYPGQSHSRRTDVENHYPEAQVPDYDDPTTYMPFHGGIDAIENMQLIIRLADEARN